MSRQTSQLIQNLVIGIGNPLRGDDRVGCYLAEEVGGICVQELTPELALPLVGARRALFVDAWYAPQGSKPWLRTIDEPPNVLLTDSHNLTIEVLLGMTSWLYGYRPESAQLLIPAFAFDHGQKLSDELENLLPSARQALSRWIESP